MKRGESVSQFFARTVTGPYKQDISFLLVGKKGTGKSYASLSMAYRTACAIAEKIGGTWEDYFSLDNVAIIDPVRAIEVMTNAKRHAVLVFDDTGISWSARRFMSADNQNRNDIFQINRIDNTVQIFSLPDQFLLDKVPRSLVSHYGEMDKSFFSRGFSTMKLFKPVTLFREGKQIQPYLSTSGLKFVQIVVPAPPKDLADAYDKLRKEVTQKIIEERREKLLEGLEEGEALETLEQYAAGQRVTSQQKQMLSRAREACEKFAHTYREGMTKSQTLRELAVPIATWQNWRSQGIFEMIGFEEPDYNAVRRGLRAAQHERR